MADTGRPKSIYDPWGSEDHWYRQFEESAYQPTGLDKLEANLWLESTPFSLGSYAWMKLRSAGAEPLDGYLPKEEEVFEGIRAQPELWSGAESPQELAIINKFYADQMRYKDIQSRGGFGNFAAAFATSVTTDPLNWVGPASSLRLAGSGIRAAGIGAASAFPVMVGQEAILGGTQATRTKEEMITGVALGTLLSGAIGGGIGYVSKRQFRSIKKNADVLIGDSNLNVVYDARTGKYYDWTDEAREVARQSTELAWVNEGRRIKSDELVEIVVQHGQEIDEVVANGRLAQNGRFVVLGDYIQAMDSVVGIPFRPGTTLLEEAQANLKTPDVPWTQVMKELVDQERQKGVIIRLDEDVPLLDSSQKIMDWVDEVAQVARASGAEGVRADLNPTIISGKVRRLLTEMDALETEIRAKKESSAILDVVRIGGLRKRMFDANVALNRILDDLVVSDETYNFLKKEDRTKRIRRLRVNAELNPTRQLNELGKKLRGLLPEIERQLPESAPLDDEMLIHNMLADAQWYRDIDPLLATEESFPVFDSSWVENLLEGLDAVGRAQRERVEARFDAAQEELSAAGLDVREAEFVGSALRNFTESARGLNAKQARSLRDELVTIKNEMSAVEARQVEYRGLLDKELQEFEAANRVLNLIRLRQRMDDYDGAELSGLDVLKIQKQKAIATAMFSQDALAEAAIEDAMARINRHNNERKLDAAFSQSAGRADTRLVSDLPGIGPKLQATIDDLGIENVGELISYLTVASIKGIGPKKIDAILENHIAWSGLQDERASNLEALVKKLREERQSDITIPERGETEESKDALISVQRGLWGLERKLGRIFSTMETRIMMRSPFQTDKRILMKLMDLNLILDQNTTGAIDNPFNAKNIIDFGRSLGHRSIRSGRQQWLYWRDGKNIEGNPIRGEDTYEDKQLRKRLVTKSQFRELVGRVLHEPSQLDKITVTEIRPYVERAVQEMRQQFYLPMLHAYERGYGKAAPTEMFSYLLRLYNIREVMKNREQMIAAVYQNMSTKLRRKMESQTVFDAEAGANVRLYNEDEIQHEEVLLRQLIPKWVDGILAAPGNRPPEDIAEMWQNIPEELRSRGRPAHSRRAFEVSVREKSHFDIEVDFDVIAPYLVLDYEEITSAYMKTRLPDLALANVFGGNISGKSFFDEFEAEFDVRMAAARDLEATNPVESARLIQELETNYGQSVTDIQAWIDITRGIYNLPGDPYSWPAYMARGITALKNITYAQLGGGFGFSALADLGATVLTNGFSRTYRTGFEEMMAGMRGLDSIAEKDLEALMIDVSDLSHMRYQNIFDINPYSTMPTAGERALGVMATAQSHLSFLSPWTNFIRHIGAKTTMRKLVEVSEKLSKGEIERHDLNLIVRTGGLNEEDLLQVNKLWKEHGHGYKSMDNRVALGVEDWPSEFEPLKAKVRKLILNEANYNAPTPQPGDKPTLFHSQIGGLLFMFKSFGFGWTQKMMLPHLQGIPHNDMRLANYMGLSVGLAAFSYVLKEMFIKGEVPDDVEEVIQQGVVRSDFWGKFATLDDVSSTFSPMDSVLGMIAPTSHYAWQDDSAMMGAIKFAAGPAGSTLSSGYDLGATIFNYATGDSNSQDVLKAATNFSPYKTNIGIHQLFDMIENGTLSSSEDLVLKGR